MTLQQLRYVLKVVECGSITSAAQALFIAQPSLSKAVSELEQELGISIFERSSRGVQLTDEGERFLGYARRVVSEADLLERQYRDVSGPRRALSISAPRCSLVASALAQVLAAGSAPRYEVDVRIANTLEAIEDVRARRSELGIGTRSANNRAAVADALQRTGMRFAPLTAVIPQVLVRQGHPLAGRPSASPDDLAPYVCVTSEGEPGERQISGEATLPLPEATRLVRVGDRSLIHELLLDIDAYAVSADVPAVPIHMPGIAGVPLEGGGLVEWGIISNPSIALSPAAHDFAMTLRDFSLLHAN